ncbi:class I SAM-dependent methyltransferase [Brochothrix thermosphacta]|uniref:class I SAM-dependent methyltransferase n=1 Tax=Brochothrix thermosphacta TaxID=2756 RepID=UPI00083FB8F0|nr:class I SAM-dependent methyltransferase [Brochothrix thermosphacta]ODJ58128.1 hypothetical protein BFR44_08125 [Brochothrix thermosphacta]
MSKDIQFEELFEQLDQAIEPLKKTEGITYLEAVYQTAENIFEHKVLQENMNPELSQKLLEQYNNIQLEEVPAEVIRRAYQLVLLKGLREDEIQTNHQMTPDSIGFIMGYLVDKFTANTKDVTIFDPAVGTGNLLMTVHNQMKERESISMTGVEVDDLLVSLSYAGANLQHTPMRLIHQDGLSNLLIDPVDAVVSDLPIGYYPNDEGAKSFELRQDEGHSFAHLLFVEQAFNYLKSGGHAVLLLPSNILAGEVGKQLNAYVQQNGSLEMVLQLPDSLFKQKEAVKSIVVFRKKSEEVQPAKDVLISQLPNLSDAKKMLAIIKKLEEWFKNN